MDDEAGISDTINGSAKKRAEQFISVELNFSVQFQQYTTA